MYSRLLCHSHENTPFYSLSYDTFLLSPSFCVKYVPPDFNGKGPWFMPFFAGLWGGFLCPPRKGRRATGEKVSNGKKKKKKLRFQVIFQIFFRRVSWADFLEEILRRKKTHPNSNQSYKLGWFSMVHIVHIEVIGIFLLGFCFVIKKKWIKSGVTKTSRNVVCSAVPTLAKWVDSFGGRLGAPCHLAVERKPRGSDGKMVVVCWETPCDIHLL